MGRPHAKRAKPIMQTGPSEKQKAIAKQRGTRQLRDKPRSVDDMSRNNKKAMNSMRDRATVKRLLMYREKAPEKRIRPESTMRQAKVAPNRKWFGNTRVIGQKELSQFRDEIENKVNDPYTVILKGKKLPMSLLTDAAKSKPVKILDVETFEETFSKDRRRKRPRLSGGDLDDLLLQASQAQDGYSADKDSNLAGVHEYADAARENIFFKGQSKRIWAELHKVVDSSDVVVQVLDVRDPMGTRCKYVETLLKRPNQRHKHLVLVLNKCDLVPTWVTSRWIKLLSAEYPTLAFHASINNPFGKGALIQLLRQFGVLHKDKKHTSVGFFGYPNVGKSSIINTLRKKRVCKAAPMPGETKIWQYVTLFRNIYLIDCPGTVYGTNDDDLTTVMKGVVRVENIDMPSQYVRGVLDRVKKQYIARTYGIHDWGDEYEFLERLARKRGNLFRGNEADLETTAKMVLNDMVRGKLPFFVEPPAAPDKGFSYTKKDLSSAATRARQAQIDAANEPSELEKQRQGAKPKPGEFPAPPPGTVAAAVEESESEEGEEGEEAVEAPVTMVKQKLSKLLCTHKFDDDDMTRGDSEAEESEEEGAFDSDDGGSGQEDEEDEEDEDEDEDEDEQSPRKKRREGAEGDEDDGGSESDVSLNAGGGGSDGSSDEELDSDADEDAAAEAAWEEMEQAGSATSGKAGVAPAEIPGDRKKLNRTLLRRRRKAEARRREARTEGVTVAEMKMMAKKKPSRLDVIPGRDINEEDTMAYGKRPRPGRHTNRKRKIGNHFYDRVDTKGKRKKRAKGREDVSD